MAKENSKITSFFQKVANRASATSSTPPQGKIEDAFLSMDSSTRTQSTSAASASTSRTPSVNSSSSSENATTPAESPTDPDQEEEYGAGDEATAGGDADETIAEHLACPVFELLPEDAYTCPFKTVGQCRRSETFKNYENLAKHCDQKHKGMAFRPFAEDPLPDGTRKIPCIRGCDGLFAHYLTAISHKCSGPGYLAGVYPGRPCPWPECKEKLDSVKAYATHSGAAFHTKDSRGLWQCHICDDYYYDLYMLASHTTRCKGSDRERRANACRPYEIGCGTDLDKKPTVLIIARASSAAPLSWYFGQEFLSSGLPLFGKHIASEFRNVANEPDAAAIFYALYDVHTRLVPTGQYSEAYTTTDPSQRSFFARAHLFTMNIDQQLAKISQNCDRPYIVSIGIDGLACKQSLMLAWLERSPSFMLVIRETELSGNMQEVHFPRCDQGLYWGFFESQDILRSIETGVPTDSAVENLLDEWRDLQEWKDGHPGHNGRIFGRNAIRTTLKKSKRGSTGAAKRQKT